MAPGVGDGAGEAVGVEGGSGLGLGVTTGRGLTVGGGRVGEVLSLGAAGLTIGDGEDCSTGAAQASTTRVNVMISANSERPPN